MAYILLFLVIAGLLYVTSWFVLRRMARVPLRVTFTPANTICLIVTEEDNSGDGTKGGGNLVNALHAVPGKTLNKTDPDPMKWIFEDGLDPEHDNYLFKKLGIQDMGGWFYTTRMNVDRRLRFGWEDTPAAGDPGQPVEELRTVTKNKKTKHVFYSGELTVRVKNADTADKLGLDMEIDFAFARKYPVRSVLQLADATAFLTSRVHSFVNMHTASQPAEYYYGGDDVGEHREELAQAINEDDVLEKQIEDELGLEITMVSIRDVDMQPHHRDLMEKEITARKTAAANLITAQGDADQEVARAKGRNEAGRLDNDVLAHRINTVIKPAAETPETLAAFRTDVEATAYKENEKVTTFAPGSNTMISP
jgi:regulator of protease activity HflC (stomatin/prohibitin superfamily)